MDKEISKMGLYEKMFKVMDESKEVEKDLVVGKGENQYRAVGEKEVLNQIKPLFKKYRLIVFPIDGEIAEINSTVESVYNGVTSYKARNITQLKCNYRIVDVDSGESEILVGFGNGADSQDKGSGKSFTYSYKTMLSKTFMLFSGEDTDNEHSDDIGKPIAKPAEAPSNAVFQSNKTLEKLQERFNTPTESGTETSLVCSDCKAPITEPEQSYSMNKYGKQLCRKCQINHPRVN